MVDQPTDVAFVLVDLVGDHRAFPDDAARDLHRLLGHRLACPPTAVLRYDRLQLLLRMLLEAAVLPTFDEYEARRQADASDAPAASTLVNAYGHWLSACDAATRFLGNASAQVAHTHRHSGTYVPYVPREVIDAITRFHDRFGMWPTKWEYNEWGRLERQAGAPHRRAGSTHPVDGTGRQGLRHLRPRRAARKRRSRAQAAVPYGLTSVPREGHASVPSAIPVLVLTAEAAGRRASIRASSWASASVPGTAPSPRDSANGNDWRSGLPPIRCTGVHESGGTPTLRYTTSTDMTAGPGAPRAQPSSALAGMTERVRRIHHCRVRAQSRPGMPASPRGGGGCQLKVMSGPSEERAPRRQACGWATWGHPVRLNVPSDMTSRTLPSHS